MTNGIRTGDPHGFYKGRSSKFREGSRVRQTPEEGRGTYQPKHCGNNNKDEDNRAKTLNDKNHQASSQKFRQLISLTKIQVTINTNNLQLYDLNYFYRIRIILNGSIWPLNETLIGTAILRQSGP